MGLCSSKNNTTSPSTKNIQKQQTLRRDQSNTDLLTTNRIQNKNGLKNEYKILDPIGHGFFGEVRKAQSKKTNQFRAIKMVNKKKISKHEENLIKNEIEIMMKIDHPHVVKIYEYFETKGYIHIVMEYAPGLELSKIWKNLVKSKSKKSLKKKKSKKNLNEEILLVSEIKSEKQMIILQQIFKQIFLTINYLHGIGIVHRDLKGENILWDGKNITILDFGCSYYYKPNEKLKEKVGTPLFVSPEVLTGSYNEKCDIWSIGILFYILLVEKPPFIGTENEVIFQQIKDFNFVIKIEDLKVDEKIKEFLFLMLEKNYEKRINADLMLKNDFFLEDKDLYKKCDDFYSNFMEFYNYEEIKRSILLNFINEFIEKSDYLEEIKFFKFLNKKNDGFLSKNEIKNYFQNFKNYNKKDFEALSINEYNQINFSKFLTAVISKKKILNSQNFLKFAKFCDKDNINGVDYIKYFKLLENQKIIKNDFNKVLKGVGVRRGEDHVISYEVFAKFLDKVLRD